MRITDKIIRKHWLTHLIKDSKMSCENYFFRIVQDEVIALQNVLPVLLITFDNSRLVLQVLSKSVGDALETFRYAQATRNFVYLFNMFFDCLNVTSKQVGQMKRKDALKPYYDENDWRFQVCVSITIYLLPYLERFHHVSTTILYTSPPRNVHFVKVSSFLINQIEFSLVRKEQIILVEGSYGFTISNEEIKLVKSMLNERE